ncbi:hypothetical protein E8E13_002418 [Curvularia kusanoi]|uniref:Uncharacterized protein n=1 Tax=Curvularia kusanoi TaxID=90978 RepID=A0A9P4TNQ5_CURKU|nr:hypothetical protein E8E13_002418 [Curvularia kusanoi]
MAPDIRGFLPDPTQTPSDSKHNPPSSTNHTIDVAHPKESKALSQQEAIIKGYKLLSMLSAESITPTIFTSLLQLRAWGYETHANPINLLHDHYFAFHHVVTHLAPGVRINAI